MSTTESNAAHGKDFQAVIEERLRELKVAGYLTQVVREFRAREPGYENPDQYYAPFLIQFNDRTRWILFSTTSMRTDRIKGQQWDADRLKHVDATISKALLVYPDEVDARIQAEFLRQKSKYDSKWEFSRIDDIVSFAGLIRLIKEFDDAFQIETITADLFNSIDSEESSKSLFAHAEKSVETLTSAERGRDWDIGGRNFERFIARILSDSNLHSMWRADLNSPSFEYACFCNILNCLQIDPRDTLKIEATADKDEIELLPSGGSPKTDVIASVKCANGQDRKFTFSCKRSTKNHVSAHQYSADAFADVLDKENDRLRALLRTFQIYGNKSDMPREDGIELEKALKDKVSILCKWVVGGYGGEGKGLQLADYVIAYRVDSHKFSIHTTDDYVRLMMATSKGFFGTPFQWTFASGQRGKSIQLKMPML